MEDKYKLLSVSELAGEEAFIRWVIHGENNHQWSQWQASNPDKVNNIAEASRIVNAIVTVPSTNISETEKLEIWNNIQSSIQSHTHPAARKNYSLVRWSLTAAAAITLFLWINSTQLNQKVITDAGEKVEITLPESSSMIVNAGSKVTYKENNFMDKRELTLKGEAFFEVTPGSLFVVHTHQGSITVLGTSFNVISRNGVFEVRCHTGKVKVENKKNQIIEITAGEKVHANENQLKKSLFISSGQPLWTEGKFTFDDQPLSVVMDELERQYDIQVELPGDMQSLRYTGLFEAGNLQNALYTITWPLHLQFEIKGESVIIRR